MNVKARLVLEEQIQEKADALRQADEEFQRERAMVDEVVRRIQVIIECPLSLHPRCDIELHTPDLRRRT